MENPSLILAISKMAAAGERAGFMLEQMIDMLDHGLEVETLLEFVCLRLNRPPPTCHSGANKARSKELPGVPLSCCDQGRAGNQ
jgi:hypothetical protein